MAERGPCYGLIEGFSDMINCQQSGLDLCLSQKNKSRLIP